MTLTDSAMRAKARDIVAELRDVPTLHLPQDVLHATVGVIRQLLIERAKAADIIDQLLSSGGIDGEPEPAVRLADLRASIREMREFRRQQYSADAGYVLACNDFEVMTEADARRHPAPWEAAEGERLREGLREIRRLANRMMSGRYSFVNAIIAEADRALASPVTGSLPS